MRDSALRGESMAQEVGLLDLVQSKHDLVQSSREVTVKIDRAHDADLTKFGKAVLDDRYLLPDESYQDLFARVASHYGDDSEHAQRIYDYMSRLWFMPSTPVLSNGGTSRGLPIACFLNELLLSISDAMSETHLPFQKL